ncbi:Uncharacterised protein [Mycobacteroides abscessus subsp. abscessus]|nr:Uncharacterised protein [Mycobacteroides abscessus subsp. abscessus]SHU98296.1 Uncharacterised protein [Mycobacteroides abscessus subsp. abscessus]
MRYRRACVERAGGVEPDGVSTTSEHVVTLANFGKVRWRRCYVGQPEASDLLPRSHSPILLLASWWWPPTDLNARLIPHVEALCVGRDGYRVTGSQKGNWLMDLQFSVTGSISHRTRPRLPAQMLSGDAHLMCCSIANVLKDHGYFWCSNPVADAVLPATSDESNRPLRLCPVLIPPPDRGGSGCRGRQGGRNRGGKTYTAPESDVVKLLCGDRDHGRKGYVFSRVFVVNRDGALHAALSLLLHLGGVCE